MNNNACKNEASKTSNSSTTSKTSKTNKTSKISKTSMTSKISYTNKTSKISKTNKTTMTSKISSKSVSTSVRNWCLWLVFDMSLVISLTISLKYKRFSVIFFHVFDVLYKN